MKEKRHLETIAIHSGTKHWSKSKVITFLMELSTNYAHSMKGHQEGDFIYSRAENPNRRQLEKLLTDLENGECCAAFSSGVAAITAVFMSVEKRSYVIISKDLYHGSRAMLENYSLLWGLEFSNVHTTGLDVFKSAIKKNTSLVLLESPSNPLLQITDLENSIKLAHHNGVLVCVDNTFSTPYNTNPIEYGTDL